MAKTDFLSSKRQEIRARLAELKPLHEEYLQLEKADAALDSLGARGARATTTTPRRRRRATNKRGPGRPRAAATTTRKTTRKRGRRGGATRANEAIRLVKKNPGISVSQMATKMGIRQNYLYRVLGQLQQEGTVKRVSRGFHPA